MKPRRAADEALDDALVAYASAPSRRGFLGLLAGALGVAVAGGATTAVAPVARAAASPYPQPAPFPAYPLVEDGEEDCFVQYPMMRGQPCPGRRHHEGHEPTSNGCGPEGGALSALIPNGWGNVDFKPSCDAHDICYGTCNQPKEFCDLQMLAGTTDACAKALPGVINRIARGVCMAIAYNYGNAVIYGGDDAYESAQEEDCECVHCKSDSPIYCGYLDACYSTLSVCMDQCKSGMGSFGGYLCGPAPEGKCGQ